MNMRTKIALILAVLLVGCCVVSAFFCTQLRAQLAEAASKNAVLEQRCRSLESVASQLPKPAGEEVSSDSISAAPQEGDVARLQELLAFKETELADLTKAYDSLKAEHEALVAKGAQGLGADLPPELLAMLSRARDRFGTNALSPEERDKRRQEFVQGMLDSLEDRMTQMPDEKIQENLTQIANGMTAMNDLGRQLREAPDEETRRQVGAQLREQAANLQTLYRQERELEVRYVAKQFGVTDVEGFARAVNTITNSPAQRFSQMSGMPFGGGFGARQRQGEQPAP